MWLNDIFRSLMFFIDKLIFSLIGLVYNLFVDIAETTIFTNEIIDLFASRIYALLGVFMLFRVSFAILSYIVNPDEFVDKNKGFSKIIGNIIITLVLLVVTPWIFNRAMDIQRIILRDNVIGKIFSTTEINSNVIADPGNLMAYETLKGFYHLDYEQFPECEGIETGKFSGDLTDEERKQDEDCATKAFNLKSTDTAYTKIKQDLNFAYAANSVDIYTSIDLVNHKNVNGGYTMSYLPLISALCAGAMVLLLITFCFDIAIRSIKLGFLRVIAPIPIASRIMPKKGKEVFDKWVKLSLNTYLDLFIRLIAIYFALFVITQVTNLEFVDSVTGTPVEVNVFVKIFIIMGALLFAKQLPKLIEDLTGFKMNGSFTLNPMNKLRQVPLVGAGVTAGTAMLGGAITGGIAGAEAGHKFRGAWQGMMGAKSAMKGKVSLMGDDKGGKSPHALKNGLQSGYKTIKGKDFEIWSPWKELGRGKGDDEISELKEHKYALQRGQATLDADLQNLYEQYKSAQTEEQRLAIQTKIEKNRSDYGKFSKHIAVIDDQIKDIKKLYHIDDSPVEDLVSAKAAAQPYMNTGGPTSNSSSSSAPTRTNNEVQQRNTGGPTSNSSSSSAPTRTNNEVQQRINSTVGIGHDATQHGAPTPGNSALEDLANEIVREETKRNMMNNNNN